MDSHNISKMSELKIQFNKILQRFVYVNHMAPFPIYDTEHIMNLSNRMYDENIDYDTEPVECCIHCKSLYLITDNEDNDECVTCRNSLNETETHASIYHYLNTYPDKK